MVTLRYGIGDRKRVRALSEETLRRHGRIRELVVRMIRAGLDPAPSDVAAALQERPPNAGDLSRIELTDAEAAHLEHATADQRRAWAEGVSEQRKRDAIDRATATIARDTATLCEYVARFYVLATSRRPGPKTAPRTHTENMAIAAAYFQALADANAAHEADSRKPRAAKLVKQRVAVKYRISVRTLETIISGISANIS